MSIVQSATKARLRFNHRGGADGARQLLGVVIEDRIPGEAPLYLDVDRPTSFAQTDAGQRLPLLGPVPGAAAQPFVIESAPRPLVTSAGGPTFRKRIPTLSVLPGTPSFGSRFVEVGVQPAWSPVGVSVLTVVDYTNGGTDTVSVTVVGGVVVVLTEATDFAAATSNDVTAENIRLALAAVGVVATRAGAVLSITTPLAALATGDASAWTVALAAALLAPSVPAAGLVPCGRYSTHVPTWLADANGSVPNSGHRPAGQLFRLRWTGSPEVGETIDAGGNTGFTFQLEDTGGAPDPARDIAPGSVVILASVGGNVITIRDDGAGRLYGQESTANASATGTVDYRAGIVTLAFSAATAGNVIADYEHTCLYLPLDVSMSWDAEMAQG